MVIPHNMRFPVSIFLTDERKLPFCVEIEYINRPLYVTRRKVLEDLRSLVNAVVVVVFCLKNVFLF